MWREFREFLLKQNALALAVAVITGAALGRVVTSLVGDLLMPIVSLGIPSGDWRAAKIVLSETIGPDGKAVANSLNYGAFAGTVIDFIIVSGAVFLIVRVLMKPAPPLPPPATKACPFCLETVPSAAKKCRACASALT
jgi:large conductance mechanosensitive channel